MTKTDTIEIIKSRFEERKNKFADEFENTKKQITADTLHDLRISIRRLAAVFSLLRMLPQIKLKKSVIKKMNLLMKPLGELRDILIESGILNDNLKKKDAFVDELIRTLHVDAKKLENSIKTKMEDFSLAFIKNINAEKVLKPLLKIDLEYELQITLTDLFRKFSSYRKAAENGDLEAFHRMRISLKKVRYTSEVLQDTFLWLTKEKLDNMHAFQRTMGYIHDLDVLIERVKKSKPGKQVGRVNNQEFASMQTAVINTLNEKRDLLFREFKENMNKIVSYEKDFAALPDIGDEQTFQTAFVLLLNNISRKRERTLLEDALVYTKNIHILHPLRTTIIVAGEMGIRDTGIILSALLHDTMEVKGTSATREKTEKQFGKRVADIVWNLTKEEGENDYEKYIDKIKNGGEETKIIKLADRLDSTRHISSKSFKRQKAYWKSNFDDIFPVCMNNINPSYKEFFYREFRKLWTNTAPDIKGDIEFPKG